MPLVPLLPGVPLASAMEGIDQGWDSKRRERMGCFLTWQWL